MQTNAASDDQRIASLSALMHALQQCRTPSETFQAIRRGLREVYGAVALMMLSTHGLPVGEYRLVQLQLSAHGPDDDDDPWNPAHSRLYRGGVVAAIIANPEARIVNDVDWTGDAVLSEILAGYASVMAIPVAGDTLPINWILYLKRAPAHFTTTELAEAMVRIAMIGSLLESRALAIDLARANEQIDRDLRQAGELQRSLLPDPLPKINGLEIATSYRPSSRAGGDLYDLFQLEQQAAEPQEWCVFIADASGHGMAAALVMTMVQAILHAHPPDVPGPADLLAHVNRQLCSKNITGFVTAFLGLYEPQSRRFRYSCAGHPPPLVKHSGNDDSASRLNAAASLPLGIDPDETFAEATVHARVGDTVLLYTDGITEAWTPDREMFTLERLEAEFRRCGAPPAELIDRLCQLVRTHERGRPPADDQTIVAIAGI